MIVKVKKCISLLCVIILSFLPGVEVYAVGNATYVPSSISGTPVVRRINTTSVDVNLYR